MGIPNGSLTVAETRRLRSGHAEASWQRMVRGIADMDDARVTAQVAANAIHDGMEAERIAELKRNAPRRPQRARVPQVDTVHR